jgi:hypothetical protein
VPFYKWRDGVVMDAAINGYLEKNWEAVRDDLALYGRHAGEINADDSGLRPLGVGLIIKHGVLTEITTKRAEIQVWALLSKPERWFVKKAIPFSIFDPS